MDLKSQTATTRGQSARLLAMGLKPETADMVYHHTNSRVSAFEWELQPHTPTLRGEFWTPQRIAKLSSPFHKHADGTLMTGQEVFDRLWGKDIPAWSLSHLLEMMPQRIGTAELWLDHHGIGYVPLVDIEAQGLFEAAVRMVGWLIDNGHFNKEYLK